jgi:hypothetical protein
MFYDDSWQLALWIEHKRTRFGDGPSHEPRAMRSGQSTGPITYWVCDTCQIGQHSTSSFTPVCYG